MYRHFILKLKTTDIKTDVINHALSSDTLYLYYRSTKSETELTASVLKKKVMATANNPHLHSKCQKCLYLGWMLWLNGDDLTHIGQMILMGQVMLIGQVMVVGQLMVMGR